MNVETGWELGRRFVRRTRPEKIAIALPVRFGSEMELAGETAGIDVNRIVERQHEVVVDISCGACGGTGRNCAMCKRTGWLEILGSGMVHPAVFEAVGYDAERYTGFAFGLGIDRVAMLRYGIGHLALLYGNDPRFLNQF